MAVLAAILAEDQPVVFGMVYMHDYVMFGIELNSRLRIDPKYFMLII